MNFTDLVIIAIALPFIAYFLFALFGYGAPKVMVFDAVNPKGRWISVKELENFTNYELKEQLKILEKRKIFILSTDNRDAKHLQALKEIEKTSSLITGILDESDSSIAISE